ncbi:hypothetical protein SCHPADRAFT_932868 [Schizopora paradoxa]|uniref:Uncharacterized protein n=1 Tax=Schizopora paradoxa TaxID=27342 RepID=A0A0H2R5Z8_9AGAM|nr:hypothetical protein SCHPADRAFT_932868 [Schizopora paradoxa]
MSTYRDVFDIIKSPQISNPVLNLLRSYVLRDARHLSSSGSFHDLKMEKCYRWGVRLSLAGLLLVKLFKFVWSFKFVWR